MRNWVSDMVLIIYIGTQLSLNKSFAISTNNILSETGPSIAQPRTKVLPCIYIYKSEPSIGINRTWFTESNGENQNQSRQPCLWQRDAVHGKKYFFPVHTVRAMFLIVEALWHPMSATGCLLCVSKPHSHICAHPAFQHTIPIYTLFCCPNGSPEHGSTIWRRRLYTWALLFMMILEGPEWSKSKYDKNLN